MESENIEQLAVIRVTEYFAQSENMIAHIFSGDKELSWDGHLYIYKSNDTHNKANLLYKIPLQVKGKECKDGKNLYSYPIEISDLKNYRNNGGCLYFVVGLFKDNYKIFYQELAPEYIKILLKNKEETINKQLALS